MAASAATWIRRIFVTWFILLVGLGAVGVLQGNTAQTTGPQQTFPFQAEVTRLMDIIINSLYQNKDIFLRELISNASDALDKLRFLALTDESLKDDEVPLEIRVQLDKDAKTLTITDKGIGMTKEEMISNLGTVARSGTSKFLQAVSAGKDAVGLIGQFGVGFYSAFLVADMVQVTSKHTNDSQHIWESDAKSEFKVYRDPRGNTLGTHGTMIKLHIKEGAEDYLDQDKLEDILKRYSEFIDFPIFLHKVKTITEEVAGEPEKVTEEKYGHNGEENVKEEREIPTSKIVERKEEEWLQINMNKPIWTRSKSEITEEEYGNFFKALTKSDKSEAFAHSHFKAEGGVEFSALLYVPRRAPEDMYDKYYSKHNDLKLYVRHVLVQNDFDDMLPRYLNFIKGVVESNDLPISVSRETIQKNKVMGVIAKKLTRSALKMIQEIASDESIIEETDQEGEKVMDDETGEVKKSTRYEIFWREFGRSIRLGILEDKKNKKNLIRLLRYTSLQSPKKLISLEQYVDRMPENQKYIYYITGPSQEMVAKSPLLEQLQKRGFDVLFFVDNVDEYMAPTLENYDKKELMSVSKEGLKFGDDDDEEADKALEESFEKTTTWFKDTLGTDRIVKCVVSKRIATSPATIVAPKWAWDANMIRIMQSQTFSDFESQKFYAENRVLEINPYHPIVKEIKRRVESENTEDLDELAMFVYDAALLGSGYSHKNAENMKNFVERINMFVAKTLKVENEQVKEPAPGTKPEKAAPVEEGEDEGKDEL